MKAWRVEFSGFPISNFQQQRQSSIFAEDGTDAMLVYDVVKHIHTWDEWVDARSAIRTALLEGSGKPVWRSGIPGIASENLHHASA